MENTQKTSRRHLENSLSGNNYLYWGCKMCVIIDTNSFASVFNEKCSMHYKFKPIYDWIISGQGRVVYGGTRYKDELRRAGRYYGIFIELGKQRKTILVDDNKVDKRQEELIAIVKHRDFNDAHIIAIVTISGCRLVCSDDSRSYPFIRNMSLYPHGFKPPKIYKGLSSRNLLSARQLLCICRICRNKKNNK